MDRNTFSRQRTCGADESENKSGVESLTRSASHECCRVLLTFATQNGERFADGRTKLAFSIAQSRAHRRTRERNTELIYSGARNKNEETCHTYYERSPSVRPSVHPCLARAALSKSKVTKKMQWIMSDERGFTDNIKDFNICINFMYTPQRPKCQQLYA